MPVTLTKSGGVGNVWDGGNTFMDVAVITNLSDRYSLDMTNTNNNTFAGSVTLDANRGGISFGGSATAPVDLFESDIVVNSAYITFKNIALTGTANQELGGSETHIYNFITLNKPSGYAWAATHVEVTDAFTFTSGKLVTDTVNLITFKAGSAANGAHNGSFVSGPVKKVGDTSFEFPVGKEVYYRPVGISAPEEKTDAFVAAYFNQGQELGELMDTTIDYNSLCNYWSLVRANGESDINISLSWQTGNCSILDSADLRMALWDGIQWNNLGATDFTGIFDAGTIRNDSTVSSYSYFVLAYKSTLPPYAILGNDTIVTPGLFTISNVNAYGNLLWYPKADLSCTNCLNPTADLTFNRKYYLYASDYKGRTATDSIMIRVIQNQAPFLYNPPAVDWREIDWPAENPYTQTAQTWNQSGDEWWYGHENSYDITGPVPVIDGYICAGYSSFVNFQLDDLSNGGCSGWANVAPDCDAFETNLLDKGVLYTSLALKPLTGEKIDGQPFIWHKNYAAGQFYRVKMTSDGGFLACGISPSTIDPFTHDPIPYNNGQGTSSDICSIYVPPYNPVAQSHGYVVKVDKNGDLVWQGLYGHVPISNMNGTDYFSELYSFVEIPGEGYRLVGRTGHLNQMTSPLNSAHIYNGWILDIDENGDFMNSYLLPDDFNSNSEFIYGRPCNITDIIYSDLGLMVLSGNLDEIFTSPNAYSRTAFAFAVNVPSSGILGTLNLNLDELWYNSQDFNTYPVTQMNSANYYVKFRVDQNNIATDILFPAIVNCNNCTFATYNFGEGKVFILDLIDGSVIGDVSIGQVEAFDLKVDVVQIIEDNGFAVLSTKEGFNKSRDWNSGTFCGGVSTNPGEPPVGFEYWNTDASVSRFDGNAQPVWQIQFDINDKDPVYYPFDYKKQECLYTITRAHDGGFVVAGNNSYNFDDYYLCKLQSECHAIESYDSDINGFLPDFEIEITGSNEVWDSDLVIFGRVIIKNGAKLTIKNQTTITFADSRRIADETGHNILTQIIVEPGGALEIKEQATLDVVDSGCDDGMWDGIQVLGQPTLAQNTTNQGYVKIHESSSIKNARIAICAGEAEYDTKFRYLTGNQQQGGGIVHATDNTFENNRVGLWFANHNLTSFVNKVFRNDFVSNAPLRDPVYEFSDNRKESLNAFIKLYNRKAFDILDNTFTAYDQSDADIRGIGIECFDCGALIRQNNIFTDLTYGVKGKYIGFGGIRRMDIRDNQFSNVQASVYLEGNTFSKITGNSFDIPSGSTEFEFTYGIWMNNSFGFSISDGNSFYSSGGLSNYGVIVTESSGGGGDIFDNEFYGTHIGTLTIADNPLLQIRCNTYENHNYAWVINPIIVGAFTDQGSGCLQDERRAANDFLDDNCDPQQHIWANPDVDDFFYYGPRSSVSPYPDPQVACSDVPPVDIIYCDLQDPETSCNHNPPPWEEREAWLEMIDTTSDYQIQQKLWYAFLREMIAHDTLSADTSIVSFMDSIDVGVSKWMKINWYLDQKDLETADSLLSEVRLDNANDSALYNYHSLLLSLLTTDGDYLDLSGDRIEQINALLSSTESVSKRAGALLEIAGITSFEYQPEQIPESRWMVPLQPSKQQDYHSDPIVSIYPNPGSGNYTLKFANISSSADAVSVEIFNLHGSLVFKQSNKIELTEMEYEIDITNQPTGLYYIRVNIGEKAVSGRINHMGR